MMSLTHMRRRIGQELSILKFEQGKKSSIWEEEEISSFKHQWSKFGKNSNRRPEVIAGLIEGH